MISPSGIARPSLRAKPVEISFTPVDNQRLANLCGALDENLRSIESVLEISIARRAELVPKLPEQGAREAPEEGEKRQPPAGDAAAELEKLVAAAKGYRPLYRLLEAQVRQAIPSVTFSAQGRYVSVAAPREFAAITLHPTEVRLGLDLGERAFDGRLQKAKLRGPGPAITHMVVLTDARQIDDDLLALIAHANRRANPAQG